VKFIPATEVPTQTWGRPTGSGKTLSQRALAALEDGRTGSWLQVKKFKYNKQAKKARLNLSTAANSRYGPGILETRVVDGVLYARFKPGTQLNGHSS